MHNIRVELGASIGRYARGDVVVVTAEELKSIKAEAESRGLKDVVTEIKPKEAKSSKSKKAKK